MNAVDGTWAGTIAVGHDPDAQPAALWRRDGDTWSRVPDSPEFAGIELYGLETGSFVLLAVGEDMRDGSGAALVSADGVSWTRVDAAEVEGARFHDVHWGGSGFTIVGVAEAGGITSPTASGYLADASRTPLITIVTLFAGFGLVSVALWAYFRFRRPRVVAAGSG